ncbi:efflux RND transporter periplasmic adaptor subunit [Ruficoccus sp. ZRK36]|uniref:efflux RND transporter periplasmic adaptor subunit n=1 Tax=Ruficoccus sp. ZRK36 TaxID=2866311 RepID=UPI001C7326DA|nr:efflux RND transporter periplasmic adaptor subunit [Ruficoccus sp. ZRK36]QYY34363.1 efflux RND transporter periplasmic adaptor subunit [Ruficoccus sp. ZRK36]
MLLHRFGSICSGRRTKVVVPAFALGCSLVLMTGCAPKNEFVAPPPPSVVVAPPYQGEVTVYTPVGGQTSARDSVEIRARVSGYLESVDFTPGSTVKTGDLLFTIEPQLYEAALQSSKGQLDSANASRDLAQTTYQRNEQLFTSDAISELDLLRSQAELELSEASVSQAEAAVESASLDLGYTKIYAPLTGRISRERVTVGNLVGSGEPTLLATIVQMDPMDIYINIDERTLLTFLKEYGQKRSTDMKGSTVLLELSDGTVYSRKGRVDYVSNRLDSATGTLEMRVSFPNPDGTLIPGLYGKVLFPNTYDDAIVVPEECIQMDMTGNYVLVVNSENVVETRYIEKGPLVDEGRVVTEGLGADEHVIVNGIQRARPGITVTPQNPS